MRRRILARDPSALKFKMPGYPYTSWMTVALITGVILTLPFVPGQRIGFISGLVWLGIVSLYWLVSCRKRFAPRLITTRRLVGLEFASLVGLRYPERDIYSGDEVGTGTRGSNG
ncbi:MAG: amino acid transporter, family [Bacillota bacterium]|nr:amino acid transporter, family [Bacillota bacterium]